MKKCCKRHKCCNPCFNNYYGYGNYGMNYGNYGGYYGNYYGYGFNNAWNLWPLFFF